jgi:nitroreductase
MSNRFSSLVHSGFDKLKGALGKRSEYFWYVQLIQQLRYKFGALRNGIMLNTSREVVLFNLRRNIHRLEKGLSYSNVKEVFAEDYIEETVTYLELGKQTGQLDQDTVKWAEANLNLYFSTVKDTARIVAAQRRFAHIKNTDIEPHLVPYPSHQRPKSSISYEELLNLSVQRRSVRYFKDTKVDIEIIRKAYDIAKFAPSACNRQAFGFLFYNDHETVNKLAAIPGGVAGYTLPALIVVVGKYEGYFDVRDVNAPIIDASLSAMGFLYAAETLGLGTVCINWPNLPDREQKIRKVIDIKPSEFVIMLIGIGYPDDNGKVPYSSKRMNNSVLLYNERIK